ncbi:hypothetical protein BDN71DRAFT_1449833 [Pleurotus eryngii]|uniref:Uncharacterized protein n=1 Tax=Pleurotus eryngii TaxID=5323 RepID=A0A9P5ZU05_PLEER|nr:hypothetical protein BDN71DRAFT_1449833 [Pleurotus eryngii]
MDYKLLGVGAPLVKELKVGVSMPFKSWNDSKFPSLCLAMAMAYVQHYQYLTNHYPAKHLCITLGTTPNTAQP